ncbi:MAG: hypothetical protein HY080_03545 [Gammaproteobacteria bacterium]|nr:hypothetical protein [Gammaproteobacteria bacterium]
MNNQVKSGTVMQRAILMIILTSIIAPVLASGSTGTVDAMTAHTGDAILFSAGTHTGKPTCSTAGEEWAITLSTSAGKAMYALLLSAQAQGKTVTVVGAGSCSVWPDRETVLRVSIGPAL